jgi:hypothetical protein
VYKLALLFCAWVCFAGTCGSADRQKYYDRKTELDKFNVEQLDACGAGVRAGYWHKNGEKVAFEAEEPSYHGRDLDQTPEETSRGMAGKYESWFEVKRYRIQAGAKWSGWKTPAPGEKFGTIELSFESGKWVIKPMADKITKGDCEAFKRFGE